MFNNSIPELGSQLSLDSSAIYANGTGGELGGASHQVTYPPPFKLPTNEAEIPRRSLFESMMPGKSRLPHIVTFGGGSEDGEDDSLT